MQPRNHSAQAAILAVGELIGVLRSQIARALVGQQRVVDQVLIALLCGGHCLLEGAPGLGKTLLVRALAQSLELDFARVQFTPDLMPADITGTNFVRENAAGQIYFNFEHGPLFAEVLLADEINRATPRTQSALLEAMAEGSVTVGSQTHPLPDCFFVLATQNPIEMEGTYPLPEAQLDRFFFKIQVEMPTGDQILEILERTTSNHDLVLRPVANRQDVARCQRIVRSVVLAPHVAGYAVDLVTATHPGTDAPSITNRFVRYGASPRGAQALVLAAKVAALLDGRPQVSFEDVRAHLKPALRHRLVLGFEAEAEGVDGDQILDEIAMATRPR